MIKPFGIITGILIIVGVTTMIYLNMSSRPCACTPIDPNNDRNEESQIGSETINIQNQEFNPKTLTVVAGTKITWKNDDSVPHAITYSKLYSEENNTNTPTIQPGETFSVTFTKSGHYEYHCTIHPTMKGTLEVVVVSTDKPLKSQ